MHRSSPAAESWLFLPARRVSGCPVVCPSEELPVPSWGSGSLLLREVVVYRD